MLDENNESLNNEKELEETESESVNLSTQQDVETLVYEDKAGGRVLNIFSKIFFILTIIGTALSGVMIFLPIFLGIVGGYIYYCLVICYGFPFYYHRRLNLDS